MGEVNHIEIDKNAVEQLGKIWESLLHAKDDVVSRFQEAVKRMHEMNGGLGDTEEAAEQLRLRREEIDRKAKVIAELPGIDLQRFIEEADDADMKASLLAIQQQRELEAAKNYVAVVLAKSSEQYRREVLSYLGAEERRDMEERLNRAIQAMMEWELQRYKELKRQEREESGFRLAPQTFAENMYRNFGDSWERWSREGVLGRVKQGVVGAMAVAAFACLMYLSGGTFGAASFKSVVASGGVFAAVGGLASFGMSKLGGSSWEDAFINGAWGAGLGFLGGAGFGWGLAAKSGVIMFTSGAFTSGLSTTIAAMRAGQEIDAELFAEIYTKAMLSGTFDMVLGKLFSQIDISKPLGYKVNETITQTRVTNFKFKMTDLKPETYGIEAWGRDTRLGDEIIIFPQFDPKITEGLKNLQMSGMHVAEGTTSAISQPRLVSPISMTVGESFSFRMAQTETFTSSFREVISVESLHAIDEILAKAGKYTAPMRPSLGQAGARWMLDSDSSGIVTDTFFIPEPRTQ